MNAYHAEELAAIADVGQVLHEEAHVLVQLSRLHTRTSTIG